MEKELNQIISHCLHGPPGDPWRCNYVAAAIAYKLLKKHGLAVSGDDVVNEDDIVNELTTNNIFEENFLEDEDA